MSCKLPVYAQPTQTYMKPYLEFLPIGTTARRRLLIFHPISPTNNSAYPQLAMTDRTISQLATPKQGPLLFAGLSLAHLPLVGYVSRASKRSFRAFGSMALPFGGYKPPPLVPTGVSFVRACAETYMTTRHTSSAISVIQNKAEKSESCQQLSTSSSS